ncbi:hypothetical protein Egran_03972 [Elaphomyces granulatus]|uniref:Aminoglycoside phosphotransferase domain-containing protein n=1 Tax=Elaphomyces granulatus TaxID=519963 RepID=A0A232LVX5_9EURO|nr:hypothetical protein Egran_03972 [Elaphomyces granulatus]
MAGRTFFGSHFIGMNITFDKPRSATWTLVKKLNEEYRQLADFDNTQATSFAHALFLCRDAANTNEQALMRIHVQIPRAGSEFELPEERARQASEEVNWLNKSELHALELSTAHCCEYLPILLGFRKGRQETTGLLPGGYISYLLMTNMPGIRLGTNVEEDSLFWSLPRTERDEIREAFKVAYRDVLTIGICPEFPGLKNLLWEKQSKKIYIVDFQASEVEQNMAWRNSMWAGWGLATPPETSRWYEVQYDDTDMSEWKL